jgi:hypothetical protein
MSIWDMIYQYGILVIDMVIHHIDMVIRDIDMVIRDIDMGYGPMIWEMTISIWEMTVSIWEMTVSIWDILSPCLQRCLRVRGQLRVAHARLVALHQLAQDLHQALLLVALSLDDGGGLAGLGSRV